MNCTGLDWTGRMDWKELEWNGLELTHKVSRTTLQLLLREYWPVLFCNLPYSVSVWCGVARSKVLLTKKNIWSPRNDLFSARILGTPDTESPQM